MHPSQTSVVQGARRYNVLACGRRWGKTTLGLDRIYKPALAGQPVGWFAPTYKKLLEAWRVADDALQPVIRRRDTTERRLELLTGGAIDFWTLDNPDAGQGRFYAQVVIDEAALVPKLEQAWTQSIRPTLTDLRGGAWFCSTPRGYNYFKVLYDNTGAEWRSWSLPTVSNPYIDPAEIEAARHELPERVFRQEYLAEFIDDSGGVFRGVTQAAALELQEYDATHTYVMGVDWGKLSDFTVISVIDVYSRQQVYLDRFNQIDYTFQLERLKTAYKRYNPGVILAERNSMGEPLIETLQRQGLPVRPFVTTNQTKAAIIEALSLALERGDVQLIADDVQTTELLAYQADRLPSGLTRYSAPEGMHDDTVMALALALEAAQEPTVNIRLIA